MHGEGFGEDAATGSANCALMGLLASKAEGAGTLALKIAQGVEMGRPSLLEGEADYSAGASSQAFWTVFGGCLTDNRGGMAWQVQPSLRCGSAGSVRRCSRGRS